MNQEEDMNCKRPDIIGNVDKYIQFPFMTYRIPVGEVNRNSTLLSPGVWGEEMGVAATTRRNIPPPLPSPPMFLEPVTVYEDLGIKRGIQRLAKWFKDRKGLKAVDEH